MAPPRERTPVKKKRRRTSGFLSHIKTHSPSKKHEDHIPVADIVDEITNGEKYSLKDEGISIDISQGPTQTSLPLTIDASNISTLAGAFSIAGVKPGKHWINQDNYAQVENIEKLGGASIYMVFDGHGQFGHVVSKHCKAVLPTILVENGCDQKRAMSVMQSDLEKSSIDVGCSGCTCVTVIVKQNRMIEVGNVGDSRAILLRRSTNNILNVFPLSFDHKPSQIEEKKRILDQGGRIALKQLNSGPVRVWFEYNNTSMGLAMSRSIGDVFAHRVGVSHEPQIFHHTIEPHDVCIVLASDGLWDVYSNDEVARIIQTYIDRNSADWDVDIAAGFLTKMARIRWEQMSIDRIDDVTCMVVKIEPQRIFQFDF